MNSYTLDSVVRLLNNYLDFRYYLLGQALPQSEPAHTEVRLPASERERPFGMKSGESWPFWGVPHARPPRDGKARAKQMQEIHVSVLDLEAGLEQLDDADLELVYKYYLFQTHTLEELCTPLGLTPTALSRRLKRIVKHLVRIMEQIDER